MTRSDGPTPGTHLWLVESDDTVGLDALTPLTTTPGNEGWPSVSPDGRHDRVCLPRLPTSISSKFRSTDRLCVRSTPALATTTIRPPRPRTISTPSSRIGPATWQIWLQNLEGYQQERLVTQAGLSTIRRRWHSGRWRFSPNGRCWPSSAPPAATPINGPRIWITSSSGGKPVSVPGDVTYQDAPTWSPDGNWIAYLAGTAGGIRFGEVGGRRPVSGRRAARLGHPIPMFRARPQWSPDGKWILCETRCWPESDTGERAGPGASRSA